MQSRVLPIARWGFYNQDSEILGIVESFPLPSGSLPACIPDLSIVHRPFFSLLQHKGFCRCDNFYSTWHVFYHFCEEILKEIFNYNIPGADAVISMADALFIDNMQRIKDEKFIIYFTEYGMTRFLRMDYSKKSHPRFTIL